MEVKVGIDRINVYVPPYYVDMAELAQVRNVEPAKYTKGIGQDQMAINRGEQDIIVLAANAALPILDDESREQIDQVIFATESAFDYSKAGATYLHDLLGIQKYARSIEYKEACYAGTAALQTACDYVRLRPDRKVLVLMADLARYGLNTGGEPTQGAGAVALLVSANPRIMTIDLDSVMLTDHQFDFWRPDYVPFPMVEGKFSTELYQNSFIGVMEELKEVHLDWFDQMKAMAFHLPFSKMGSKAIQAYGLYLTEHYERDPRTLNVIKALDRWDQAYEKITLFGRRVGNIYTGSLYLSLLSMLTYHKELSAGDFVGLFSYGSGAVSEVLKGQLVEGYQEMLDAVDFQKQLDDRRQLTVEEYEDFFLKTVDYSLDGQNFETDLAEGQAYLKRIDQGRRYYEIL